MAKKSEFLKAFGVVFEIWKALTDAVLSLGGSDEDMRRILTSKVLRQKIAELIVETKKGLEGAFTAFVDYAFSVEEMVRRGRYDWVNSDINSKYFPHDQTRSDENVTFELVHLNRAISSDEAIRELESRGLRPVTLPELLAFGEKYPEEQRKYSIVALGSVWRRSSGFRYVPYLFGDSGYRLLYLFWFDGAWFEDWRFLAVRK